MQQYLRNGTITSVQQVQQYLVSLTDDAAKKNAKADHQDNVPANNHAGLELRAVIETAPYDNIMPLAREADDLRANGVGITYTSATRRSHSGTG